MHEEANARIALPALDPTDLPHVELNFSRERLLGQASLHSEPTEVSAYDFLPTHRRDGFNEMAINPRTSNVLLIHLGGRANPLINTRWLTGADMLRLFGAILLIRMVLSEQTSGAVGFLTVVGLGPDQLHGLFAVILLAMIAGTAVSAFTLNMEKLNKPIAIALGAIAVPAGRRV